MSKKILVFGSLALSLVKFRYQLLNDLGHLGYEVIACAPDADDEIISILNDINVQYVNIALCRTGVNPYLDVINLLKMRKTFKKIKPDYVLSYTIKPVIYGSIAAKLAGVKKIYSMVTGLGYAFTSKSFKSKIVNGIVQQLLKISLLFNEIVFFQNPDDIEVFKKNKLLKNEDQAFMINGSGVDLDYYKKTSLPKDFSFLLIARLIKDKGVVEYAEAARIVKKKYPDVKFNLAGWIDSNPTAINQSTLNNWISDGVIDFLGSLDDVRPAIENCSVYVLPSYREGTPRTVLEAMAMGRPIITTDAPGCRETVEDGENGFLVPIKEVGSLVTKMIEMIENPILVQNMAEKSYDLVCEKYDVHKVNKIIIKRMYL